MFDRSSVLHFFHVVFSPSPPMTEEEQHWSQFSQSLSLGPFIMWLANEIADRLVCREHGGGDLDRVIVDVQLGNGKLQHRAEEFLHRQRIDCDPTQERRITLFRHFIALRLRHVNYPRTQDPWAF